MAPGWAFNRDGSNSLSSVGCGNKSLVPFSIACPLLDYSLIHRTLKLLYNPERSTTMARALAISAMGLSSQFTRGFGRLRGLAVHLSFKMVVKSRVLKRVWLAFLECRVVEANSKYLCDDGAVKCTGFTLCG
jgi:hypothetical protein